MKRVFILFAVLFVSLTAFGQADSILTVIDDYVEILQKYQELADEMQENYNSKNFKQTELTLREMITLLEKINLSDDKFSEARPIIDKLKAMTYYNLACSNSLLNQKKQAIDAFEKSVALGYSDYYHTLEDTDLDNIRNEERFVSLLRELSVKTYLEKHFVSLLKELSELKKLFSVSILQASGSEKRERWEYATRETYSYPSDLNDLGRNGWELVSFTKKEEGSDRLLFVFKRKLP